MIGALLSFAGAALALWLVREHDIEREPMAPEPEQRPDAVVPESAAA